MFIQIITGKVDDLDGFEQLAERWERELRPGAKGFLGSTIGVTPDDTFFAAARFESPEAARANSDRPEQGAWWSEMQNVTHAVEVHDSSTVYTILGGGSDDAGFVQVMKGRIKDPAKAKAMLERMDEAVKVLSQARPDVMGQVTALHDDGDTTTDIIYFTSESEARANEAKPWPPDAQEIMNQMEEAFEVEEFLDLTRKLWLR